MRLEIPLCPFFRWRNGDREVNWFTHSHRAFKVWHLRLKSSFVWLKVKFLTYFSTLEFITNSPRRTHCERVYHIERASHTGARAPNPYPTGSCPSQDSWCGRGYTFFLVSDPLSQDFSGTGSWEGTNWFNFHWLLGDVMAKAMPPSLPPSTYSY